MKKAVGYIRVSTENQSDKFGSDAQKQAIMKYAKENGFAIVEWFCDVVSGVKEKRENFDKILFSTDIANPPFEAVIVFKSDRVARDTKLYFYYLFLLQKKGVDLISVEEDFGIENEFSDVMRSLMLFVAEQERRNIALRTSSGRKIKALAGGFSGGRPPYGYKVFNHQLVPDEYESNIVKTIFKLYDENVPQLKIAEMLKSEGVVGRNGKPITQAHIHYFLKNKMFYQGYIRYGTEEWTKGVHDAIID